MDVTPLPTAESIQRIAARVLATHPTGHRLCLIGGFRYRLLSASARASTDMDYHWEGDLEQKQTEIVDESQCLAKIPGGAAPLAW